MPRAVSGALGRAMVRTFAGILGDLGRAAAPGLVDAAAVQAAQAIAANVPRGRRAEMARRFIQAFADEIGVKVSFPEPAVKVRQIR